MALCYKLKINILIKIVFMIVLTRSKTGSKHSLAVAVSSWASSPGSTSASTSELLEQPSTEGGVDCGDRKYGVSLSTLPPAVCICGTHYLSYPALTRKKEFVSNTAGRKHFAIDIKPIEVNCKLQNYIYL